MAGNANSGRRPKSESRAKTLMTIAETAPKAARMLADYIDGKVKMDNTLIEACKYMINQDCGMPKQRQEIDIEGEVTTGISFIYTEPKVLEKAEKPVVIEGQCTEIPLIQNQE